MIVNFTMMIHGLNNSITQSNVTFIKKGKGVNEHRYDAKGFL